MTIKLDNDNTVPADDLITAQTAEDDVAASRANLDDKRAAWCEHYVAGGRFISSEASQRAGVTRRVGLGWRDRDDCRAYCAALIRREVGKVVLSGASILRELACIATVNPADMFEIVTEAQVAAEERYHTARVSAHMGGEDGAPATQVEGEAGHTDDKTPRMVVKLRSIVDLPPHIARSIAQIDFEDGVPTKIKFHDKIRALDMLARAFSLFDGRAPDDTKTAWTGFAILPPRPKDD